MTAWVGLTEIAPMHEGETVFISRRHGRGRQRRGPARQGARLPRDRQRRRAGEGRLRARGARLRPRVRLPRRTTRARRWPTASTSTSTTSAARSSRRRSARCAAAGGSPSAARSRSTTPPSCRPGRGTSSCWSASASTCAASSSATTRRARREFRDEVGGLIADGRLKLAETVVEGGLEAAPARSSTCCAGATSARWSSRCEAQRRRPAAAGRRARPARAPRRAVLGQEGPGAWSIPKGEHDDGEDPEACARREFARGAGVAAPAELVDLGTVRQKNRKEVRAFYGEGDLDVARSCPTRSRSNGRRGRADGRSSPRSTAPSGSQSMTAREKLNPAQAEFLDRLPYAARRRGSPRRSASPSRSR